MVEWLISDSPVGYSEAVAAMEAHVAAMQAGGAGDRVWLLEHPPLYTAGTSAREADLLQPGRFPVHRTGRGGQYTYHGPGQRVAYAMIDLRPRGSDLRRYVHDLEEWIIRALARFNIRGERREGRVGIWVRRDAGREDKIAAIGVRVRRWIAFHGIAVNLDPDLSHFQGIVPCGIASGPGSGFGVTSLHDLGILVAMAELDMALKAAFAEVFGLQAAGSETPAAAQ
jgi:lipoyl(octanoyl) transferase